MSNRVLCLYFNPIATLHVDVEHFRMQIRNLLFSHVDILRKHPVQRNPYIPFGFARIGLSRTTDITQRDNNQFLFRHFVKNGNARR